GGKVQHCDGEEGDHCKFRNVVEGTSACAGCPASETKPYAGFNGPAGSAAIDAIRRIARGERNERRQYPAAGDEFAARRIIRLADYFEHSRAEGLHVLAQQPDFAAVSRRVLGGSGGRDDEIHGAVAQGDFWRSRTATKGAAVRCGAERDSELPIWNFCAAEFLARSVDWTAALREPARAG